MHMFNRMGIPTNERASWRSWPVDKLKARLEEIRNADVQQWERRVEKLDKEQQAEAASQFHHGMEGMEGLSFQKKLYDHPDAELVEDQEYFERMDVDSEMKSR